MRILVACKVVAQEQDISILQNGELDFSKVSAKISQFDLSAIQTAVDIKQMYPNANITAISIGAKLLQNPKIKKDILSRGIDELVVICNDDFENLLPHNTAKILAQSAKQLGFDFIICGDGSDDLFASEVGIRAGTLLEIPCINAVGKILSINNESLVVQRELESKTQELELKLPALVCVSSDINTPSIPGMKAILAAGKKPIKELQYDSEICDMVSLCEIKAPKKKDRLGVIVDGDNDEQISEFISNLKKIL